MGAYDWVQHCYGIAQEHERVRLISIRGDDVFMYATVKTFDNAFNNFNQVYAAALAAVSFGPVASIQNLLESDSLPQLEILQIACRLTKNKVVIGPGALRSLYNRCGLLAAANCNNCSCSRSICRFNSAG